MTRMAGLPRASGTCGLAANRMAYRAATRIASRSGQGRVTQLRLCISRRRRNWVENACAYRAPYWLAPHGFVARVGRNRFIAPYGPWRGQRTSTSHRFRAGAAQCATLIAPYGLWALQQDAPISANHQPVPHTTGNPAARHSGNPSWSRRTLKPRARSTATAS
jgi:hypothetical protein